jgi:hypothetical protein
MPGGSSFPDPVERSSPQQRRNRVFRKIVAGIALLCAAASSAEARTHNHHHYRHSAHGHSYAGRPSAWCGWYMRSQVGSDPGPEYNLARAWTHYGINAGGPSVGTIVVWRHHVGKIVGQQNGQWLVQSGNDGHAVRTRPRSLAGAIAFRRAYASM